MQSIKAKVIRLVRTDGCGNAVGGATGQVVSAGFTQVQAKAQMLAGKEFVTQNAWGDLCVNDLDVDRLKRYDLTFTFCDIDPTVVEMLTGSRLITDASNPANPIGIALQETPGSIDTGVQLELWTKVSGGDCGVAPWAWIHWLFPFVRYGTVGDFTYDLNSLMVTVNASSQHNPAYGAGPFEQWAPNVGATEHLLWQATNTAPPAPTNGYANLTLPTGNQTPVAA